MKKIHQPCPAIALTMGDPCGIGPEIIIKALAQLTRSTLDSYLIIGDRGVMEQAVRKFGGPRFREIFAAAAVFDDPSQIITPSATPVAMLTVTALDPEKLQPGKPGPEEGRAAAASLSTALELIDKKLCRALVTAPASKAALKAGGFPHPGHTGWLAERTGSQVLMMLIAGRVRAVPLTIHVPLAEVPALISRVRLSDAITLLDQEMKKRFTRKRPRIAVAALNPHAGEEGLLGREEIEIISPAVEDCRQRGINVSGPFSADAMFSTSIRRTYDAALCMYHDQALIPIKTIGMNRAVNLTLGLPFIRTSPAHGSAPDIAWEGEADPNSMINAIKLARRLSQSSRPRA